MYAEQIFALMSKLKNSLRSEVVDLESFANGIIKINTSCAINDNLEIFGQDLSHFWIHAETFQHKVTFDGNYSLLDNLFHFWSLAVEILEESA